MVFALSRALYFRAGVRFNDGPLGVYWQYLDPFLLRRRLAESLFYLHGQPPLFNLYLGAALKTGHERAVFIATFLACGLAVYAASFALMRRLAVSAPVAFLLATWMATSPGLVAYENWLFYSLPVAALLLAATLMLERAARTGATRDGVGFAAILLVVCGARSLYHLLYLVAAVGLLARAWRQPRRAMAAGALSVLLLAGLYAKNAAVFGHFAATTWTGMNLARLTTEALDPAEARSLVGDGTLHAVSLAPAFSRPPAYPRTYFEAAPPAPARALTWEEKTTGAVNFNHAAYVAISEDYLRDARWVVLRRPGLYLRRVAEAWGVYLRATSDLRFLGIANIAALRRPTRVYEVVFFGRWPWRGEGAPRYWGLVLGLPLVFLGGVAAASGRGWAGRGLDRTQRLVVAFMCFNIAFVALVGNLLELGENNRFRFETDPLSLCLLGLVIEGGMTRRRRGTTG